MTIENRIKLGLVAPAAAALSTGASEDTIPVTLLFEG